MSYWVRSSEHQPLVGSFKKRALPEGSKSEMDLLNNPAWRSSYRRDISHREFMVLFFWPRHTPAFVQHLMELGPIFHPVSSCLQRAKSKSRLSFLTPCRPVSLKFYTALTRKMALSPCLKSASAPHKEGFHRGILTCYILARQSEPLSAGCLLPENRQR